MREILFRGKRVDNGEWVEGLFSISHLFDCDGNLIKAYQIVFEIGDELYTIPINPETIGQYTGLTDKNRKKIFEGDIVQYQPEYEPVPLRSAVVYFADKYNYPAFDLAAHDYEANGLQCAHEEGGCEVIGNIHDNPELLEVEK